MGLIKEPLEVDFFVEPRSLSIEEKKQITNYIKEYKAKISSKKSIVVRRMRKIKAS
jgi:hypothetical protein